MPAPRSRRRARIAALVSVVLAITGFQFFLAPRAAQAAPSTGLVISEVYGGGGNGGATYTHDFIELYNPTGSAIPVGGMSVQYRSATGTTPTITNLTGSVPAGGHYLVQEASNAAVGLPLPTPDATGTAAMAAGAGVVILASDQVGVTAQGNFANAGNPANVIDTVGYGATATTFETTNTVTNLTSTTAAQRVAAGTDTDANNADFSEALPTPTAAAPAALSLTNPGPQTSTAGSAISTLQLAATGGTPPYTYGASNLPPGLGINTGNGQITGTPNTAVGSPFAVNVTVQDSAGVPATDNKNFSWTVNPAPVGVTPIADIQGTGATSPLDTQVVNTEGVVTARYPTGGLNGFYIQTPGADTPNASDAIFVYGGPSGFTTYPAIGASVDVSGTVSEFSGQTQITANDAGVTPHGSSLGTVTPKTQIPGTDCALPGTTCLSGAALDTAREVAEGEAFQPTAPWTATDVYDGGPFYTAGTNSSSMFGEIAIAADSTKPLVAPTEVIDAQATAPKNERIAYNNAHRIILDDGSSTNYTTAANTGLPFPWYTDSYFPRVGSAVTFPAPVVFTFSFNAWRILPTTQVVGAPTGTQPQFSQERAATAAPQNVGGDIKLATFNVLNFFPTTGNEYVAAGLGTCTYFLDRQGNQITNNSCNPNGPRGAANTANLVRQRDKIVSAINTANADIVSLEELENSVHFNKPRDFAINELVTALNADAGPGTWAAVPSPAAADLPPLAEQDVIRNGFIYKPANVALVGGSVVLADESTGTEAFADAREPLAQAFKAAGSPDSDAFAVIVNHFKSKGSGTPDPDGQGNANDRRILQANSLVTFANAFKTLRGITRVFLAGDFNAYSEEDPIQVLEAAGYTNLESTSDPDEESYNFDGQVGSLDHVMVNAAALADVEDVDIWTINGYESVYYEYSRFNYNVTNLYDDGPFKSSDHNPEIIGIDVPSVVEPPTRTIQILGTNDFHGRLQNDTTAATAGAAVLAGAVKQLRGANPDTVFAAAGDLIGASTFESFIQKDKPTIDALNEAGLEVSAAGNHEFDQGSNDLVNRVMAPYNATTNPFGGANWQYISANVRKNSDDSPLIPETWTKDFGSVKVGFVGAVTEHLPELVSPAGISTIHVTDIVNSVNTAANTLKAGGADVVVMLVHEGAPNTNCATMDDDPTSDFGSIINGVNNNVDAIISGHTHLAYDCEFDVPGWAGRPVTKRPVVSAGQYGMALNQLVLTVDTATGQVQTQTHALLPLKAAPAGPFNYPSDPNTAAIVAAAVAAAGPLGAQPLGQIGGPFFRGKLADGTTENRGAESTLGNLVAEVQKWATTGAESGAAQIAFMNPGGLRQDMVGTGTGAFPRTLTFKQAADVQPFANTLVNMDLTGAQIKTVLEQQWQAAGAARPFLKLGISKGFTYTSVPPPAGSPAGTRGTVTGMWLNGVPINPATTYSVTVNSFLASGGDGFLELNNGAGKQDTGKTDLQAMVDYMAAFGTSPDQVNPDYKQNGVNTTFPVGVARRYAPGDHVTFDVSGWSMTNALDTKDTSITVKLGATTLGTPALDNAAQAALPGFDVTGKVSVDVVIPPGTPEGPTTLTLTGATTNTSIEVPITIDFTETIQVLGTNDFHGRLQNDTTAATAGAAVLAGAVKQLRGQNPDTVFAAAGDLIGASTFESFIQHDKPTIDALNEAGLEVSAAGNHEFDQGANDLTQRVMQPYNATTNPFGGANWQYISANIRNNSDNSPLIPETWTKTMDGVKVGFVGAVTEHLPELVSPAGISEIHVDDVVTSVNTAANQLKANGADVVVMLVHEGAPNTNCATMDDDPASDFGSIINGVNANVDAIISGHTHLAYDCHFPVAGWAGRPVTERPVVSAGQYGMALNKLTFEYNKVTNQVVVGTQALLPLKAAPAGPFNYPVDPNTQAIVDAAVTAAGPLGAVELGKIGGPFFRGKLADGTTENRGAESTLGNLVAEVQKWATRGPESGAAQIAFMNPGGLRADMVGTGATFPKTLTYRQAADVQPFANTLVNMDLTGAQIKTVLEQQWQAAGAARPFLKLGISKGFTYTSVPPPAGSPAGTRGTVTGMWLNGVPINPATTYSVTVNSFLASGGDGFLELNNGAGKQDTGKTDLQGMVDYMAQFGSGANSVNPDYKQNGVHVTFPVGAPASYAPGDHLVFSVSGWSMTNALDTKDTAVTVKVGATTIGTATLNNAAQAALPGFDVTGTANIDVVVPNHPAGTLTVTLSGATTGTETTVTVPTQTAATTSLTAADLSIEYGQPAPITVTVNGGANPTGTVELLDGVTSLGTAPVGADRRATITVPALTFPVGSKSLTAKYLGDSGHQPSQTTLTLTTTKATSTTTAGDTVMEYGQSAGVTVNVGAAAGVDVSGTVTVMNGATTLATAPVVGGVANVTLPANSLEPGTASLTASYSGNANVKTSEDTFTVTVAKADSTVVAPDVAVPPGGTGTVSVTVTAVGVIPTGTVTVKNGATELGSAPLLGGVAQITLPAVPNGTVLTADYAGDEHVKPGSDTFTVTCCDKLAPVLAISDVAMQFGQSKTATLTVTGNPGGSATGTATLKNGGTTLSTVPLSGGVATFTIPAGSLPVGGTVLTAEYSGDANLLPGAKAFTVTVSKAGSTTKADVNPDHPTTRQKVKLTVKVTGANGVEATGQVKVIVDGDNIGKKFLEDGKLKLNLGKFGKGKHKVKVLYLGSSTVEESDDKVTFTVT